MPMLSGRHCRCYFALVTASLIRGFRLAAARSVVKTPVTRKAGMLAELRLEAAFTTQARELVCRGLGTYCGVPRALNIYRNPNVRPDVMSPLMRVSPAPVTVSRTQRPAQAVVRLARSHAR
jgi:hypothetical protein